MANSSEIVVASSSNFEEEVKKLMGKGKVHMVCSEFLDAVKCFEEATKRLDEKYGQAADECGQAYFHYGKSLLEVARMEGGVLGNALQGAIDSNTQENGDETTSEQSTEDKQEDTAKAGSAEGTSTDDNKATKEDDLFVGPDISELDEDEKEKIGKQVTDAMTEDAFKEAMRQDDILNKDDKTTSVEKGSSDKDEPMMDETDDAFQKDDTTSQVQEDAKASGDENQQEESKSENEETTEKEEESKDENQDAAEGEETENGEGELEDKAMEAEDTEFEEVEQCVDEEDPTYMELAWQMLEIARIIYKRRDRKEKLMLAQCHLKLGEIQMEQEQFLGAVEDFLKCLDIQKLHLSPDDRLLAETAYNIALAFSFQSMYGKSKDYYSLALETIGIRIKSLQQSIDEAEAKSKGKEKATPDNPFVANRKELQELQELFPEIKAKVDDAGEMMKQSKPNISDVMGNGSTTTIGFGGGHSCSSSSQPVHVIATKKKTTPEASASQPVTMIATKKKTPVAASDISHLIHRNKRKPEEAEDDIAAKKPRQDPETCKSDGKTQSTTNGSPKAAATAET